MISSHQNVPNFLPNFSISLDEILPTMRSKIAFLFASCHSSIVFGSNGHDHKQEFSAARLNDLAAKWGIDWGFSGISTFAHLHHSRCLTDPVSYDIAVLGAPFDTAVCPIYLYFITVLTVLTIIHKFLSRCVYNQHFHLGISFSLVSLFQSYTNISRLVIDLVQGSVQKLLDLPQLDRPHSVATTDHSFRQCSGFEADV
jgi:hypothetical protein